MMFMFQVNMRPKTIVVRAFNTMGRVNASSRSIVVGSSSRRLSLASTSSADTSTLPTHLDVTKVILKRKPQSKAFRNGNQLVFSRAIDRFEGAEPKMAKIVQVLVHDDPKPVALGYGVYNPNSLYRVRILCHRFLQPQLFQSMTNSPDETTALRLVVHHHLRKAIMTRQALQLPKAGVTDTYRLINGEGDQLSGLAVDIIGKTAVVMSSAGWCQQHQTVITECLREQLPKDTTIVWKTTQNRLEQDGYEPDKDSMVSAGLDYPLSEDEMVISMENGIRYQTYPYGDGQKTGVYCDQRENRLHVAQLCQGKRVLDLCCYHGGFSLNAAINGGALQVTGVDSSEDAVVTCRQDAELNGLVGEDRIKFVRSDITTFLQESVGQSVYDVVVLDPPKLAPSANGLDKARRKYHSFNRDAIKLVAPEGGLLLTCTCSAAMTQKDGGQYFLNMVQGAALATGREVTLLRVSGAASCHTQSPIAWPAGAYLTAALFYVHPVETA